MAIGVIYGCIYRKEEIPPTPTLSSTNCNTSSTTYSKSIAPIINQYCLSCHGSSSYQTLGGGRNLDGYSNIASYSGKNGVLINSINFSPGYNGMPYGGNKIPDCDILMIQTWINAGTPNN